jgi:beta-alanine--pyruvate transaminase
VLHARLPAFLPETPMKPAPHPLETTDLSYFWMPFTANRQYKAAPRLLTSAQGMYYRDADGREVLVVKGGVFWLIVV